MWTIVLAICAILSFIIGVPAAVAVILKAIRSPVREQLRDALKECADMTRDRDYYRGRVDELETELRTRRRW